MTRAMFEHWPVLKSSTTPAVSLIFFSNVDFWTGQPVLDEMILSPLSPLHSSLRDQAVALAALV